MRFLPVAEIGGGGGKRALSPGNILEEISLLSTMDRGMSSYPSSMLNPSEIFYGYKVLKSKKLCMKMSLLYRLDVVTF